MEIKLLPCPICTTPHFKGVDSLRSTLVSVATNIVSCPVCQEKLLGLDKLTIHLFSHIDSVPQKTSDSPKISVLQNVVIGIPQEIEVKSEVGVQKEIEEKIESLDSSGGPVKCDICTFSFSDQNILEIHQKLLHQTTPDLKTGNYSYHCHLCSKKFKMRGSLMVHLRVAHYGFIRKEFQNFTLCHKSKNNLYKIIEHNSDNEIDKDGKNSEKNGHKVQENKQWECDVCSKLFTTKYFLKKHKRLHTGEMPYCCNLCNKSFTFQQSYHKHMLYHSSDKPHTCNECGRAFKELSTLQNHARIHSGERPFVCETCGKCFRQRVSYLVHRRIHTGAMPYKCPNCDKSFRYKVSQKSHKCLLSSPVQSSECTNSTNSPNLFINSPQNVPNTQKTLNAVQNVAINTPQNISTVTKGLPAGALIQNPKQLVQILSKHNLNLPKTTSTPSQTITNSSQNIPSSPSNQFMPQSPQNVHFKVPKCIMNVDLDTGNISVVPKESPSRGFEVNDETVQKKSILLNNNEFIEISYNKADLGSEEKRGNLECQDDFEKLIYADPPTLSNLLPEVESLYLNSSPSNDINMEENNEELNDIRDKCLAEFLQGIE